MPKKKASENVTNKIVTSVNAATTLEAAVAVEVNRTNVAVGAAAAAETV